MPSTRYADTRGGFRIGGVTLYWKLLCRMTSLYMYGNIYQTVAKMTLNIYQHWTEK